MFLIVGLGNPGKKYEKTRHNLGFRIVESLRQKFKSFSDWKKEKKFQAEISQGKLDNEKIILAKPQTFMNSSGKSVKRLTDNLQLTTNNLLVIHDDIDLPLGKIRISIGRGPAGHRGVESIIRELKAKNFIRFRIGISHFAQNQKLKIKNQKLDDFVLEKFNKEEEKIVKEVIKKTIEAIEMTLKEGVQKAMSKPR